MPGASMASDLGPNATLLGVAGSRARLSTPALLLDLDALERNIALMARRAAEARLALRPHAKAHKCVAIARRQMAAGAIGIACATLGEAEVMAAAGISGLLLTSPVVTPAMLERLQRLLRDAPDTIVAADNAANVAALDAVAADTAQPLQVVVDFDVGQHRTGAATAEHAVALARQVAAARHLRFAGIQAYYGHLQQVPALADRQAKVLSESARIRVLCGALTEAGLAPRIVTGGGTGTAFLDLDNPVFTEIQPGSYLLLDSCYGALEFDFSGGNPFEPSLFVQASVVSTNQPGLAVCNAGLKSFATDSGRPRPVRGAPAGASYRFMGDEHGGIEFPAGAADALRLADAVELLTSHCDPTVNLYDRFHCVRADMLVDIWPVDARGR